MYKYTYICITYMHLQSVNFTEELLRPGGGSDGGPSTDWQDGIRLSKRGGVSHLGAPNKYEAK